MDTINKPNDGCSSTTSCGTTSCCTTGCSTGCGCPSKHHRSISVSAIIAGALASLGLGFLANLLSLGAGFSTYAAVDSPTTIAILTFVWIACSVFIAMFIAGLVTGSCARHCCTSCCSGMKHGFLAWCLGLVGMIFLTAQLNFVFPVNIQHVIMTTSHSTTMVADKESTASVKVVAPKGNAKEATVTTVNSEKAAMVGAAIAMQAFFIFLISAVAMMLGAHCGSRCDYKKCNNNPNNP